MWPLWAFVPVDKQAKNGLIVLVVINPKSQEELDLLLLGGAREEDIWNQQIHWGSQCPC